MTTMLAEVLNEIHQRFAAASLRYGHGTDSAWDEAVALVLGVTGLPDTKSSLDAPIPQSQANAMRELARRRIEERQPLAYLLGSAPYCGELFEVPVGVMVPRSPIGPLLLGGGLRPWIREPKIILDLCCGTGCLGILAAKCFPDAEVLLADIDALAVATARQNIAKHALARRVRTVRSDLFAGLEVADRHADDTVGTDCTVLSSPSRGHHRNRRTNEASENDSAALKASAAANNGYDLILCNPPYVDARAMASLAPEFLREPALGLAGGDDGLALINRVLDQVSDYLTDDGVLVGEVGAGRGRLEKRWPSAPFIWPDLPDGGEGVFLLSGADARGLGACAVGIREGEFRHRRPFERAIEENI